MVSVITVSGEKRAVFQCNNFFKRLKGLLGKKVFPKGTVYWIAPCNSVHTFWMKFPIDVIFLDKDMTVLRIEENIFKGKVLRHGNAKSILELEAGGANSMMFRLGDKVELINE
jgi:uncharacterized membrane protein (UPF0127 family)